jgi:hypothetical protein
VVLLGLGFQGVDWFVQREDSNLMTTQPYVLDHLAPWYAAPACLSETTSGVRTLV